MAYKRLYSLPVLEARNPKAGCGQATFPLKALGEDPTLTLPSSGGSRHSLAYGHITPVSASTFLYLLHMSLLRTLTEFRAHLDNPE